MSDDLLRHPLHSGHLTVGALKRHRNKPVLFLGDTTLTGGELAERISQYIQAFEALGAGTGSISGLLSLNRPEVLMIIGASQTQGYRRTALHPLGSLDDHAFVLSDAEVTSLIIDPNPMFVERAVGLLEKVPSLKQILTIGPVPEALAGHPAVDLTAEAAKYSPKPLVAADLPPDHIGGMTYTGGTTGKPKGVMGTYRSGATMTMIQMAEWEWPEDTRFLICTPLSHAGAAFFIPTLLTGGAIVVLPHFEAGLVLETIEKYKITATMIVPTMLYVLLDSPKLDQTDVSSLQTVYYGAAACSPTRLQEAIRRLGPIFFQYYGQAECPMAITSLKKEDHDVDDLDRLATCGRPTPWVKVRLLDDDLNEVPRGEPGEICVQGPLVMAGYWKKPAETEEALKGGWLHTGDIAREDEHGFYTIVDRKKDMIVSGGFNVFPREIEDVLAVHPAVSQCAVIGVPDEKWGEAVKAIVVLRPGASVEPDELAALVKEHKGAHHTPKSIEFADAIPLSPLGKPDKKALRAQYWGSAERQVH